MFNFIKLNACGNDFLVFFNKIKKKKIKKILYKKFGLSCDQLLFLTYINYFKKIINIKIYNNNLNEAKNCGNGIRCLTWFFLKKKQNKNIINFKLKNKFVYAYKNKKKFFTIYKNPLNIKILIRINNFFLKANFVNLINLHLIIIIKNLKSILIKKIIFFIKNFFNDVYNIEFVQIINRNNIFIRIFEKDVGETYSCGSGIISSCYCILKNFKKCIILVNSIGGICFILKIKKFILIFGNINFCFLGFI